MLRFKAESPNYWVVKYNGRYGMVMSMGTSIVWSIAFDPRHTARWHKAETVLGAKRACSAELRKGRGWKDLKKSPTEVLQQDFQHHAKKITDPINDAFSIYLRCNTMRRIWEELTRRGVEPMWPNRNVPYSHVGPDSSNN